MAQQPSRLKIPSCVARSARTVAENVDLPDTTPVVYFLPVVQWRAFRVRILSSIGGTLDVEFCRPARQAIADTGDGTGPVSGGAVDPTGKSPAQDAYVYTFGQPAAGSAAVTLDVETGVDVTELEHAGENWAKVTFTPAAAGVLRWIDASGVNHGQYT